MTVDELGRASRFYWDGGTPMPGGGSVRTWAKRLGVKPIGDLMSTSVLAQNA